MPNYDGNEDHSGHWGYSFDQLSDMLSEVVKTHSKSGKVTLVCHDFGCHYGYHFQKKYPDLVKRLAAIDIGPISPSQWAVYLATAFY